MTNIQGTKDTGYEWYQLLARIFKSLGMKPNSTCRIWLWVLDHEKIYLTLVTDDILIASILNKPLQILKLEFDKYFTYTVKKGLELAFLFFN